MSVHCIVICIIFIASQGQTFTQINKCKHTVLPTLYGFTHWLACHADYQVLHQGQSIYPHEDERVEEVSTG